MRFAGSRLPFISRERADFTFHLGRLRATLFYDDDSEAYASLVVAFRAEPEWAFRAEPEWVSEPCYSDHILPRYDAERFR